jgi:hypothetical protein
MSGRLSLDASPFDALAHPQVRTKRTIAETLWKLSLDFDNYPAVLPPKPGEPSLMDDKLPEPLPEDKPKARGDEGRAGLFCYELVYWLNVYKPKARGWRHS